ncbi:hypothetical protein PM082_015717 [Marasmius tenuissimus]|nr:hypothetical protein PM082_015717 [Marasmius tenuissimus]
MVIKCADKVKRRFLPEFFSYSADYPEKIAVVCVKYLGNCLCVCCIIEKSQVQHMGTKLNMRCQIQLKRIDNERCQKAVNDACWHIFVDGWSVECDPVKHLLDDHSLIPTWLHYAQRKKKKKDQGVDVMDKRFRCVPTFGRNTIRRFHNNVSQMKKLAARDFEDILQCAMPCFEGLFDDPVVDKMVQDLLFDLATWHAYAKLQLHTDSTVVSFEDVTSRLGKSLRKFAKDSNKFETTETPREKSGAWVKKFSLATAKLHFLGDYLSAIKEYGTTDSYTTGNSECQHQEVKSFYRRMNKQKHSLQIVCHEGRKHVLNSIKTHVPIVPRQKRIRKKKRLLAAGQEPLTKTDLNIHHHTSAGTEHRVLLSDINWIDKGENREFEEDMATRDFTPKLKDHLLHRLLGPDSKTEYITDERSQLTFTNDTVFAHKMIWFNYNTYNRQSGFCAKCLYRLFFPPPEDANAFGFVDPADVICGAHIIPAFNHGPSETGKRLAPTSLAQQLMSLNSSGKRELEEDDWKFYYVGMFANRDTVMRFCGGGVGHPQFHEYLRYFEKDTGLDTQVLLRYDTNREEVVPSADDDGNPVDKEEEVVRQGDNQEDDSLGSEDWVMSPVPSECSNEDEVDGAMDKDDKDMEHAVL